jgi:hypothetical protein
MACGSKMAWVMSRAKHWIRTGSSSRTHQLGSINFGHSLGANTLGHGKVHSSFEHGMSPTKLGSREGTMDFESRERRNDDHRSSHRIVPNLERFRL